MIDDPPVLTIKRKFHRPSVEQLEKFKGAGTGAIVDCLGGRGGIALTPINPLAAEFCGVAVTCYAGPADNLAVFGAMELSVAGDVIVIATDAFISTAVIGDMVLGMAKNSGVVAMVTDGYVRDIAGICAIGLPCYAAGVTPNSPARNGPGSAGLPIVLADTVIESGDIIVGDRDGVVVIPFQRVDDVVAELSQVLAAEAALEAKVKEGLQMPEFVTDLLAGSGVKEV